ncbi:hypothetical protein HNY73_016020 [Argiope bruennichi]|uniref:Secreted protein n=1 Tax=Argiope bruennichi TaxID=94029 RepID=A0A8T0EMB8_ARGBR|nr:hypothetical protein HNY73_016020 [Argiope bruennichi]
MFRLVVFACMLCVSKREFPGMPLQQFFSHRTSQEAGNGVGGGSGTLRYRCPLEETSQYRNYALGAGYPLYGYGLKWIRTQIDGFWDFLWGLRKNPLGFGYGYGGVFGIPPPLI